MMISRGDNRIYATLIFFVHKTNATRLRVLKTFGFSCHNADAYYIRTICRDKRTPRENRFETREFRSISAIVIVVKVYGYRFILRVASAVRFVLNR